MNDRAPVIDKLENAMRYEDMRDRPVEGLRTLVAFLGAPFSEQEIRDAVDFASFENLKKLEKENSFKVRRGKVGGFVDYFNEDELAQMASLVDEQLSPYYGYGSAR